MRVAIVNSTRRMVGGAEGYVHRLADELDRRGHEIALVTEEDLPATRDPIALPRTARSWNVDQLGAVEMLARLREWAPQLIYTQIVRDPALEAQLVTVAPSILFAHAYYGTCISGLKTTQWPVPQPCGRVFGIPCLAHYFPRRCGGLDPRTMLRLYQVQSARNRLLGRYRRVLTASTHMREEYLRHGVDPGRARVVPLPVVPDALAAAIPAAGRTLGADSVRLLFLGRMDALKGGSLLLQALPRVREALGRRVHLVLAGDGPERGAWEARARELALRDRALTVEFTGWVDDACRGELVAAADLLVVPSVWPEPFGMVGPEAGILGLPAVAFAVGGIPDWLVPGVSGQLAPGGTPSAAGLARAIVDCVGSAADHARLREGAREVAKGFTVSGHMDRLEAIFEEVVREPRLRAAAPVEEGG